MAKPKSSEDEKIKRAEGRLEALKLAKQIRELREKQRKLRESK